MDNGFSVDLAEVAATISSADVIVLRFTTAPKRLLLDFRSNDVDGPYIGVVDPVRSAKERYKDLRRLRPRFELPERIHVIWWPGYIESLRTTEMWDRVRRRVAEGGHDPAACGTESSLRQLLEIERDHARAAIRGDGFRTIWSASQARG